MPIPDACSRSVILATLLATVLTVAGCVPDRIDPGEGPYAPGVDPSGNAIDGITVGHRLMDAGQYELAVDAFTRAALTDGLTAEILSGLGTANLGLGRLGQAEDLLRRAVELDDSWPEAWNNLGVVLMERGQTIEAEAIFRRAYALDNGESDAIRDNLRLALAKSEKSANENIKEQEFRLVRRGQGDIVLSPNS